MHSLPHSATIVYYIHGFNSSPQSHKAQVLAQAMAELGLSEQYRVPALSYDPERNIQLLEESIRASLQTEPKDNVVLVGSSMGGFYSAFLSQKYGLKAALVNPVVDAANLLETHIGELTNDYTGERYEMSESDLEVYRKLTLQNVEQPEKLLLLVQRGDEVLDSQLAIDRYAECANVIQQGGSHGFDGFEEMVPRIFKFLGVRGLGAHELSE